MKMINKKLMFTLLLFIFISSITVVSAVDVSDNVTSTDYQVSTVETISVDEQQVDEYNNIESNVNEAKEISKDKSVKSLNGVTHTINSESYSTYFTNGILNNAAQDGDVILIDDTFEDSSFIFDKSITLTSTQNGILKNCIITFNSNADYSNVTNLNIVNIDDDANDGINVYSATNMTIEDNTIYIDSNHTAKGITLNNANGTIIYNNDITVNAYTNEVTYYYEANYANPAGTVETAGIGVYNSSYTNVESNTVSMSSTGHSIVRDTLVGIAVQGNIVTDSELSLYPVGVFYNTVKNNIVNLDGNLYAYGITLHYYAQYNTIINNTINADSSTKFYVCGIQLSYYVQNNQIYDNKINLTALNFTYGINSQGSILSMGYNDFYNNRINLSSRYNRGIESYNGYYDKIRNNNIKVNGDYSNGIGLGGIYRNNITNNVINSTGTIFTINKSTADDIPFKTDGIYVNSSHYYDNKNKLRTNYSRYNNINDNHIITNGEYAIDLDGYYNNIINNYINSSNKSGDNAVNYNTLYSNNICSDNYAYTSPNFLNNRISLLKSKLQGSLLKSDSLNDNEVTTHVITNDNWKTFFIMYGLQTRILNSSLVSDNDVLDLQGEISLDYHTIIDKAVNITSTTNNGKISSSGNTFEINNKGSHSNLTNICLYNTQLILNGADYINLDHINVSTENFAGLGSGKGVTSIREGCDYINVTNSYFYVYNNGGFSNFVLAGSGFVNVDNNTIHSEGGMVGNVVYLNFYNVQNQTNQFINITNNNITGPTNPAQICWLIGVNAGNDVLIKGNNLTYTGDGIINGVPNLRIEDNNFNNVTNIQLWTDAEIINNTGIHNFEITGAKLVTGNEINGNFVVYGQKDLIVSNNVIKTYNDNNLYNNKIFSEKFVCENNTIDAVLPLNISGSHGSIIQNNTITTTADYSIYLTNSSSNIIRNNTLIASKLTGDRSVYGPGDYIENNAPTKGITEYVVASPDELDQALRLIRQSETDEAIIYLEEGYESIDRRVSVSVPNKKVTIDGSRLGIWNMPFHFVNVVSNTNIIIKNFKMDTISYDGGIRYNQVDNGYSSEGNITFENCFINFINMTEEETPNPITTFVHSDGTGYISFKSCTIIDNIDCYTALTSGNEVYIVDSIILGSDVKLYDADNKPDILEISQNYISSYDKAKYPYVKDEVVAMVNGVVDTNIVQVTGDDKVVLKWVVSTENGYDNITHQFGYEDGVLLGSTNENIINTTGLIFNKSNNYTITLDENPVDETVTLYAYLLYDNKTDILLPDIPEEILEEMFPDLIPEDYTPGTTIDEKKLMDIVEYIPTKETSININLSTLTYGADNQIIINIIDMDGNLIETSGPIDVSINDDEKITYYFKNGELKIPYKITSSDDLTIFAAYGGNNQYRKTNTTAIFTPIILDIPTNITITVQAEAKVNSPIPVTIILTADDNLLTGQEVTISTASGDETIELTKGFIICQYTPTTVGEETITVTFNAKDYYLASSANVTITVTEDKDAIIEELNNTIQEQNDKIDELTEQNAELNNTIINQSQRIDDLVEEINQLTAAKATTVILDPVSDVKYNSNVTISGILINDDSIALSNQVVTLTIGDKTVNVTTRNGIFEYTTKFKTMDEQTVTATYSGTEKYLASEDTIIFTIAKQDVVVTVDQIEDAVYGDNVTITGKFTDANGKAISNSNVRVFVNGKKYLTRTDKTGAYSLTAKVTSVGENNVTVGYGGNDNYNAYEDSIVFNADKQDVIVTYNVIEDTKVGENITITGKFTDKNGKAITNSNVKILINGKKYLARTDSTGVYTFTTRVTAAGINNITVGYSGNDKYNAYEDATTFNADAQDVIVTVNPIEEVTVGENVTITGTFTDKYGKAVTNSNVRIILNGKKYYAKTDSTGVYTFTTTVTTEGINNITAGYGGSAKYNACETNTTFVAKAE